MLATSNCPKCHIEITPDAIQFNATKIIAKEKSVESAEMFAAANNP